MTNFDPMISRNKFFQLWRETAQSGESIISPSDLSFEDFAESNHRLFTECDENEELVSYLKLIDNETGDCTMYKLEGNDANAERL